jgi:SWI/SNF-related matrix-associated actin-dependent regulator 1 of chromatin subfamily A
MDRHAVLLRGLRQLACLDPDHARSRNHVGFSAQWSEAGHRLAQLGALTPRQAVLAARICVTHRRQLPDEVVEAARAVLAETESGPGAGGGVRVDADGRLVLEFDYDPDAVAVVKSIPPRLRTWDASSRTWALEPDPRCARAARRVVEALELDTTPEAEAWIAELETMPVPPAWCVRGDGDSLLVATDDRSVSDTLGLSSLGRWDHGDRAYRIPLALATLEALIERARKRGLGVPASAEALAALLRAEADERTKLSRSSGTEEEVAGELEALWARLREALPRGLELYPYQVAGVAFLERARGRAVIGDQMGLGKTVQALAWLALHPKLRPAVILCPGLVRLNWLREVRRWLPGETAEVVVGKADAARLRRVGVEGGVEAPTGTASIVIVNYESVARHADELTSRTPAAVVLDECQYIKERSAQRTKATLRVSRAARHVIALSGTPITNRPIEFYNVLNLLRPDLFRSWWAYANRYCGLHHNGYGWDASGATNTEELSRLLRGEGIMLRRTKDQVLQDLPPKRRVHLDVELLADEGVEEAVRGARAALATEQARRWLREGGAAPGDVLAALSRLRLQLGLAKAEAALGWLAELASDRPVVVFVYHREAARVIQDGLRERGLSVVTATGDSSASERQAAVDAFQAGRARVFVGTFGAAGVGLTLTTASDVVLAERDWVPAVEEQAEDRCHRVGQQGSVTVWVLMSDHRVDRLLNEAVERKRAVLRSVLDGEAVRREEASAMREFARALAGEGDRAPEERGASLAGTA